LSILGNRPDQPNKPNRPDQPDSPKGWWSYVLGNEKSDFAFRSIVVFSGTCGSLFCPKARVYPAGSEKAYPAGGYPHWRPYLPPLLL